MLCIPYLTYTLKMQFWIFQDFFVEYLEFDDQLILKFVKS